MAQTGLEASGLPPEEYDYDLFPFATTGIGIGTAPADLSNYVPDGFSLKVARLTLTNKNAATLVSLQIVANGSGVVSAQGAATQTIFTYELGATSSVQFSEDDLEMTVPAGFKLQAFAGAATVDVTGEHRYLKGGFT